MKFLFITILSLAFVSCGSLDDKKVAMNKIDSNRAPASTQEIKKLIEMDQRRGCCSHHGGVSHCSYGSLYCNDGWISGCGC